MLSKFGRRALTLAGVATLTLAPFADARITVPALFVGGLGDPVVTGPALEGEGPMVAMLGSFCDDLRGKVLIEGAGHWNQQEKPEETNAALLEFLSGLDDRPKATG